MGAKLLLLMNKLRDLRVSLKNHLWSYYLPSQRYFCFLVQAQNNSIQLRKSIWKRIKKIGMKLRCVLDTFLLRKLHKNTASPNSGGELTALVVITSSFDLNKDES